MTERKQLEQAIAHLEAQRATLGDAVVDAALAPLREKLATLETAEAGRQSLAGERKRVTVMFADISGFTPLSATLDPEAVRDLVNACFERLVPVVEHYEGTIDKFMGDSVMALFGAPVAHENDPERALRVALDMRQALAEFSAEHGVELGLHFGINTGLVIAGGLGTPERQEYSVMGDAVNLASRLEDLSEPGEILVGPDTYRLTAALFEFEALEPVRVKGKAEPVPVYRLVGLKARAEQVRDSEGLESPLVGREAECASLAEALGCLQLGVGGIVTIVGEAGIGKSRLMAELRTQAPAGLEWVEGRCLAYGSSMTYHLWLDVLRGLLGVTPEDPPEDVRDRLRERVRALCPDRSEDLLPYLGRLMSLPLPSGDEAALHDLEGETFKSRTFQAMESLVACTAQQRPLVVVCEDLHWADPTSVDLLEHLLALTDRVPLLFVTAFRPEREHGSWRLREAAARDYPHRHTDLWLRRLSASESAILVNNLLGVRDLHAELRAEILRHAEGNPFFVEEILRSLIDRGAIAYDEAAGRWLAARDVADIEIPDTLHGVLVARIDHLPEETKRVLQLAAVIGRVFLYRVLAAIGGDERGLERHLLALQQEGMIRERARLPEREYIFKHHLTQEAAYNGLLKVERSAYHRRVAEALEALFPGRVEEQVGLLAHHWERAEVGDKAAAYLLRAGDRARLAYAHLEAIGYCERSLVFLRAAEEYEQAARTLMKLGLTYHLAFDFPRARQAYEEGFVLWQRAGEIQEGAPPPPAPHALRVGFGTPTILDPSMNVDLYSIVVIDQLFSGLAERTLAMSVEPDVARSWQVSEGGRKYVFHLREDVRWSDGTPVTAGDFEYAWKRALDPATRSPVAGQGLLDDVKGAMAYQQGHTSAPDRVGVRALDDVTLVVELEGPTGHFPHLLTLCGSYPVPRHVVEAHGEAWTEVENLVTNGPFRLEAWQPGRSAVLVRNPAYHGRFTGNVQRLEVSLLEDPSARLELYEADDLDILHLSDVPAVELDRARQRHAGEYIKVPALGTLYVGFDASRPPFDDPRARRAFVLATDRETLVDEVLSATGFLPAMGGFVPPEILGHSAGIALPYDPDGARELLAEAGYPDGSGFPVVEFLTDHYRGPTSEYLQAHWRDNLGVEVTPETMAWGIFLDRLNREPPHIFCKAWPARYPDPDDFLRASPVRRRCRWQNERYDRLVEEARRVTDQEGRMEMYQEADRILVEEAAIMPLSYAHWNLLVKPWVRRWPASATKFWFWKDVIIEPH